METLETRENGVVILSVKGRVDAANARSFEQEVLGLIDAGERRLVLDLAGLDYVSSAGLRVLLVTAKRLAAVHGKLALASLREPVREVFEIAGFSAFLRVFPTREDAVAAV
jgi:anti-anti-sigma factor